MTGPRVLTLDIENAPALADVWSTWGVNIYPQMLRNPWSVISFAAKWRDAKKIEFRSDFHDGHEAMINRAHALLGEADAVVTFNGDKHDLPHLNREFLLAGLTPPSPYKSIDLRKTAKRHFKFVYYSLEHLCTELGLGHKLPHKGWELWQGCMAGDPKAWNVMRRYNKHDVVLTEAAHDALLSWIDGYPHHGLFIDTEVPVCRRCGSERLQKRGEQVTDTRIYQRYQCQNCGGWGRSVKSLGGVSVR